MRIVLSETEIEEAIEKLILDQVNVPDDVAIHINLKATRGDEGYTAEIDLVLHNLVPPEEPGDADASITPADGAEGLGIAEKVRAARDNPNLPKRRGRPVGPANKPRTHRREPDLPIEVSGNTESTDTIENNEPDPSDGVRDDQAEPGVQVTEASDENLSEVTDIEDINNTDHADDTDGIDDVDDDVDADAANEETIQNSTGMTEVDEETARQLDADEEPEPEPEPEEEAPEPEPELEPDPPKKPTKSLFANLQRPNKS